MFPCDYLATALRHCQVSLWTGSRRPHCQSHAGCDQAATQPQSSSPGLAALQKLKQRLERQMQRQRSLERQRLIPSEASVAPSCCNFEISRFLQEKMVPPPTSHPKSVKLMENLSVPHPHRVHHTQQQIPCVCQARIWLQCAWNHCCYHG